MRKPTNKPYTCRRKDCKSAHETARGLASHIRWHTKKGEPQPPTQKEAIRKKAIAKAKRNPDGSFTPEGALAVSQGNKGGCRFSGRTQALRVLDDMLTESKSKARLKEGLRKELLDNPVGFFKNIIMPLVPKESLVRMEGTMREAALMHIFHSEAPPATPINGTKPTIDVEPITVEEGKGEGS